MTTEIGRLLTAMITPFKKDGSVDYEAAEKLAAMLVADGSDGVVVSGTTGESPALSEGTRRAYRGDVGEFCEWLEKHKIALEQVDIRVLSDYVASLGERHFRVIEPLARTHPELAHRRLGDPQLDGPHPLATAHQRALICRRASGDREHCARAIDQNQAGVEGSRRCAEDLGQSRSGLDCVGYRLEGTKVR